MAHPAEQNAVPVLLLNPVAPRRFGHIAAILAIACVLTHIPLVADHFAMAPVTTVIMVVVSVMCVPCARKLWNAPTTQDCTIAALLASTMLVLHVFLTLTLAGPSAPTEADMTTPSHHHHVNIGAASGLPQLATPPIGMHPMAPATEIMYYMATTLAILQIILNIVAIAVTVRRAKAVPLVRAATPTTHSATVPS